MKRNLIVLVICFVVAAGLGGIYLLLSTDGGPVDSTTSSSSKAEDTSVILAERAAEDIESVTVENSEGGFVIQRQDETSFVVENLSGLPVVDSDIDMAVYYATVITAVDTLTEEEAGAVTLDAFGLAQPLATLTVEYTDGTDFTLYIGASSSAGGYTYVKLPDAPSVYLVYSNTVDRFFYDESYFIQKQLTPVSSDTAPVTRVELSGSLRPEPVVIEYTFDENNEYASVSATGTYTITSPAVRTFDSEQISSLTAMAGITADSVVAYNLDDALIAAYGLGDPYSILSVTIGEQVTTLYCSAPSAGVVYVMVEDLPVIYSIEASLLPWYELEYQDMVYKLLLLPSIDTVSALEITMAEGTVVFNLDMDTENNLTVLADGAAIDQANFRRFYQVLLTFSTEGYTTETPDDENLLLAVTYHYVDGSPPDVAEYFSGPPRQAYMRINGVTEFVTRLTYIEKAIDDCARLLAGEEVSTIL